MLTVLRMGSAVDAQFRIAHVGAQVFDESVERLGLVLRTGGVDFVPEVPGEDHARAAPSLSHEFEAALDVLARLWVEEQALSLRELAIGVVFPADPEPRKYRKA